MTGDQTGRAQAVRRRAGETADRTAVREMALPGTVRLTANQRRALAVRGSDDGRI